MERGNGSGGPDADLGIRTGSVGALDASQNDGIRLADIGAGANGGGVERRAQVALVRLLACTSAR